MVLVFTHDRTIKLYSNYENVKLTLNSTPVGNVILFIGGPVDWEWGMGEVA